MAPAPKWLGFSLPREGSRGLPCPCAGRSPPDHLLSVLGQARDPDIHVGSGAGVAVVPDGMPADEEVLNVVGAEQPQELFEVGW